MFLYSLQLIPETFLIIPTIQRDLVCRSICSCIPDGHLHSDINQVSHWYNNSPDDEHMAARNMYRIEINIQEETVRQVGYSQGWRQDARSTEHNIQRSVIIKVHMLHVKYSWFLLYSKEMLIKIQPDATVCRYLFTAKSVYMFRVSQHRSSGVLKTVTAASSTGHNTGTATSLQCGLIGTVASSLIFINTELRCTEPWD